MAPVNHRRCIACRRIAHRDEFLRVVREHSSSTVKVGEGMGRSAYLCPNPDCLRLAQKKNRLGRALRAPIPDTIYDVLQAKMAERSPQTQYSRGQFD